MILPEQVEYATFLYGELRKHADDDSKQIRLDGFDVGSVFFSNHDLRIKVASLDLNDEFARELLIERGLAAEDFSQNAKALIHYQGPETAQTQTRLLYVNRVTSTNGIVKAAITTEIDSPFTPYQLTPLDQQAINLVALLSLYPALIVEKFDDYETFYQALCQAIPDANLAGITYADRYNPYRCLYTMGLQSFVSAWVKVKDGSIPQSSHEMQIASAVLPFTHFEQQRLILLKQL